MVTDAIAVQSAVSSELTFVKMEQGDPGGNMKIRHIIAATDFSHTAEAASRRAALLAKDCDATLQIVHALYELPFADTWRKLVEAEGITADSVRAHATAQLNECADSLEKRTAVHPTIQVIDGKPAQAVAAWALQHAADLIVVGAHGEHLLFDLFVGSTALKLLRLSVLPVLLVKQNPPFDYERVVIATDFSPAARAAADRVAAMLPAAELHLFHAYEAPFERQMAYAGSDDETIDHYRRLGEAEAKRKMEAFVAILAAPGRYRYKVRHGYAPALISQFVAEMGADLLVSGSHRQSEVAASLLGSVAAHLVNESRTDLLLVPSSA